MMGVVVGVAAAFTSYRGYFLVAWVVGCCHGDGYALKETVIQEHFNFLAFFL